MMNKLNQKFEVLLITELIQDFVLIENSLFIYHPLNHDLLGEVLVTRN